MKKSLNTFFILLILGMISPPLQAQVTETQKKTVKVATEATTNTDFTDRQEIITCIENFYIGDHTGSIKHKKLSMHPSGAYRYINREGEYNESKFQLDSDDSDMNYQEYLISIEIYNTMAIVKLRLDQFNYEGDEYKVMTLFKTNEGWKITSIVWGFGIKQ